MQQDGPLCKSVSKCLLLQLRPTRTHGQAFDIKEISSTSTDQKGKHVLQVIVSIYDIPVKVLFDTVLPIVLFQLILLANLTLNPSF